MAGTGFDGRPARRPVLAEAILLGGPLNPLFFVEGGGTAAHIMIRSLFVGCPLAGLLAYLMAEALGVPGKILEQDFGRTKQAPHPFGGEERSQSTPETEAIVTSQNTLDQGAELMRKHGGNVVFRQNK